MKCLIKNRKTGEEIICEKVEVGEFSYYYNNEYPSIEEYGLSSLNDIVKLGYHYDNKLYKKVIATNNKSLDLPQVTDEVGELGENYLKSYFGNNNDTLEHQRVYRGFLNGFKQAKETYSYTKYDMVEFTDWIFVESFKKGTSDFTTSELLDIWEKQRTIKIEVE